LKRKSWILFLVVGLCVLFAGVALFATWNSSMTVGLMGNSERAKITSVRFVENAPAGDTIKVTFQNSGVAKVNILQGYVNGINATNINSGQAFVIPKATELEITLIVPNGTLVYGTQQQIKLITAKGTIFVYSLTYDSTSTSTYNPLVDDIAPTPRPLQASELTPPMELNSYQSTVLFMSSAIAAISVVFACLLANYALHPKNSRELFVMLFFVTIIVVFALVAIVFPILFPPQIGLMQLLIFVSSH
jgi:ABC-type sugar transport system permease subunit